jgi:hypothetical protein
MRNALAAAVVLLAVVGLVAAPAGAAPSSFGSRGCVLAHTERRQGQSDRALCRGGPANHAGVVTARQHRHTYRLGTFRTGPRGNAAVRFRVLRKLTPGWTHIRFVVGDLVEPRLLRVRPARR